MHYLIIAVLAFALSMLGCEGKTGPAGPSGSAGPAGPVGPAGADGSPGATGPAGPAGATGPAGPQGPAGADGKDGAPGADGAPGPAGPKGDKGDQGDPGSGTDPGAIQGIIDGVIDSGVIADVHHIALIQDGDGKAADRTVTYMAHDNFKMSDAPKNWDTVLDVNETTMITAKAANQAGDPIPGVEFGWASKNEDAVTVDGGMIEAVGTGSSEITVTAMGRGIEVKFTVEVLSEVKAIVIDSPANNFYLSNGESVAIMATAYDTALDDGEVDADAEKVNVKITYQSSDTDVITIDGSTAKAVGVGSASITAHYADIKSKGITINVTPGGDVTHKITYTRIAASERTFTRIYPVDDPDTDADESETASAIRGPSYMKGNDPSMVGTGGDATDTVVYTVQVREFDSEGNAEIDEDYTGTLEFTIQGSAITNAAVTVAAATAGETTVTVAHAGDDSGTNIAAEGQARIILSMPGADKVALPAVIVVKQQLTAAGS